MSRKNSFKNSKNSERRAIENNLFAACLPISDVRYCSENTIPQQITNLALILKLFLIFSFNLSSFVYKYSLPN